MTYQASKDCFKNMTSWQAQRILDSPHMLVRSFIFIILLSICRTTIFIFFDSLEIPNRLSVQLFFEASLSPLAIKKSPELTHLNTGCSAVLVPPHVSACLSGSISQTHEKNRDQLAPGEVVPQSDVLTRHPLFYLKYQT